MELENKKQKQLVEDCLTIQLGDLPKGFHRAAIFPSGDSAPPEGEIVLGSPHKRMAVSYEVIPERHEPHLKIRYKLNGMYCKNRIGIEWSTINFGQRPYLCCPACGRRCNKLYIPPGNNAFRCRFCHHLVYESTRTNRQVLGAELFYRFNRLKKIEKAKEKIKRVDYNGKITRKAAAVMYLCEKWLPNEVIHRKIKFELAKLAGK